MLNIRVNDSGQITIPPTITEELGIERGQEFNIIKRDNYYIMMPLTLDPLKALQKIMEGEAETVGWASEDDVIEYMREVRKEYVAERYNF